MPAAGDRVALYVTARNAPHEADELVVLEADPTALHSALAALLPRGPSAAAQLESFLVERDDVVVLFGDAAALAHAMARALARPQSGARSSKRASS